MFFLLKRTPGGAGLGLVVLSVLALALRGLLDTGPPLFESPVQLAYGVGVCLVVLASDGMLHGLFGLLFGPAYLRRYRELAEVFQGQGMPAMVAGALMAGLGEELLFRGLSTDPVYLAGSAVVFGLLHHFRRSLWPFTAWAIFQGLLFSAALFVTGALAVTMVAHFLHDLAGFVLFRHLNRRG